MMAKRGPSEQGDSSYDAEMEPRFFKDPAEFRAWLDEHYETDAEVLVRLTPDGIRRSDSVDQALCYGWVDEECRRLDGDDFAVRFTPRREHTAWNADSIAKVEKLAQEGLMRPAGVDAVRDALL
jgi:uncharacterized protein YdeI (YjbR/CyaY-like superfamily)